jgi:hypothetical protein
MRSSMISDCAGMLWWIQFDEETGVRVLRAPLALSYSLR